MSHIVIATTQVLTAFEGEAAPAAGGGGFFGGSMLNMLLLFAVIGGIMYFLVFRPQQQEKKRHDALLAGLKKDDKIVTKSGMHGRIVSVGDNTVTVQVDSARLTFDKDAVAKLAEPPAPAGAAAEAKK